MARFDRLSRRELQVGGARLDSIGSRRQACNPGYNSTMLDWRKARRSAGFGLTVVVALIAVSVGVRAQGGRSYGSPTRSWWEAGQGGFFPWEEDYSDPDGQASVLSADGAVNTQDHPFFEPLGANERACVTCHQPANAMSLSTANLVERWNETEGRDPVFAAVDGSNCPTLPQDARSAHALLLERGVFRIALPWPPKDASGKPIKPEFQIELVRDPTGCNRSAVYGLKSSNPSVSVYRRPRVAANLTYLLAAPEPIHFMADGREQSLESQATSAILTHEEAAKAPTPEQLRQIVEFERQIYAAQSSDLRGGLLNEKDAPLALGPENLAARKGATFDGATAIPVSFSFEVWRNPKEEAGWDLQHEFRASVARGADVFFARRFRAAESGNAAVYTCATCHAGGAGRWMDVGTTNVGTGSYPPAQASPDLPLFRITCDNAAQPHPLFGRAIYTQDPGRGLITGKCADVGSIVMQQLRGLSARAPYFSNGSAKTLREVVDFYDRRFGIGYSEKEKLDLINFLSAL